VSVGLRGGRLARIYDLRSTFASNALAAGITVYELARIMGTSVLMIEAHLRRPARHRARNDPYSARRRSDATPYTSQRVTAPIKRAPRLMNIADRPGWSGDVVV
jgi:hypothetical protein